MKFGLVSEMQNPLVNGVVDETRLVEETIEQCVLADQMGFNYLWLVEHHFLPTFSASSCPDIMFGALSRLTKQIRLGFGVVILPHHHPIRVAERVAMVDQLSGGRVDFGTGRSVAYEQLGFGVDPRDTRGMWAESLEMVPKMWREEEFSWDGEYWKVPARNIIPKPLQKPHPPIWLACNQTSSYGLAAEKGLGVLAFSTYAAAGLADHIKRYKANVKDAQPAGAFVNDQWANFTIAHCGEDNDTAQELGARAIKQFFGPDRPYTQGQTELYKKLVKAWGGVPEDIQAPFRRFLSGEEQVLKGSGLEGVELDIDFSPLEELDAKTLAERGVIVAGNPEGCIRGVKRHHESGADQLILLMQTDQITHEQTMSSIELFGTYVIPEFNN